MRRFYKVFFSEDAGQDLVEYTLLMAFVALASAGLFLSSGANVEQVWSSANSVLTAAATSPGPSNSGGGDGGHH
ncbi:MAG TPA: hypothetical protein VN924_09770 [Bryobacteraceae bacterium]|nr:hypothetical protein [Bryobacteraceae bacterium]